MGDLQNAQKSRDNWKGKARVRGDELRYRDKKDRRHKQKIKQLQSELDEARGIIASYRAKGNEIVPINNKNELVFLIYLLFLIARISFRGISRVLKVMEPYLGVQAPCAQTVINWTLKLAISRMQYVYELIAPKVSGDPFANGFIWIIDTSVAMTSGKILAVLALDANHYKNNQSAPTLQDVHCVGVAVDPTWNGDLIAEFLKKVSMCWVALLPF